MFINLSTKFLLFLDSNVVFPNFDKNNFNKEILATNEEKGIKYQICLYRKKV